MRLLMLILALLVSGAAVPAVACTLKPGARGGCDLDSEAERIERKRIDDERIEAVRLYFERMELLKAAERGNDAAQFNLGLMYEQGQGKHLRADYAVAVSWYRKSAEQGHAQARIRLGTLYASGRGVPQDYGQAYMWFSLADNVKDRDIVAAKMTDAQIDEAQKLARAWKPE
jgi:TPR repeat protein